MSRKYSLRWDSGIGLRASGKNRMIRIRQEKNMATCSALGHPGGRGGAGPAFRIFHLGKCEPPHGNEHTAASGKRGGPHPFLRGGREGRRGDGLGELSTAETAHRDGPAAWRGLLRHHRHGGENRHRQRPGHGRGCLRDGSRSCRPFAAGCRTVENRRRRRGPGYLRGLSPVCPPGGTLWGIQRSGPGGVLRDLRGPEHGACPGSP